MKTTRTFRIIRLMYGAVSSTLHNEKLVINENIEQLEQLGGIYIKFLQMLILSLDPNNETGYKKLLAVYEDSPPDNLNVFNYLRSELSAQSIAQIKSIGSEPFATGSFGQVYRAELHDGRHIIIKVLRPSVQRYLRYDLKILGLLSWAYSLFDRQKMLNFRAMFKDFKQSCLNETNYLLEAAVATEYYESAREHPHLVIPYTYKDLSNKNVLTQDFIDGVSVTKLLAIQKGNHEADAYCQTYLNTNLLLQLQVIGTELFKKALTGEFMQADPHPGNIIILPNNKVALIDFGMSTYVGKNRQSLYELVVQYQALYNGELSIENFTLTALKFLAPELYAAITQADHLLQPYGYGNTLIEKLRTSVTEVLKSDSDQELVSGLIGRKQIMKVLFFEINRSNRFGFTFDLSSTTLLKAVHSYFMLMHHFDDKGYTVLNVLNEGIWFAQNNMELITNSPVTKLDPNEALEMLSHWFDKMARNDPWLMSSLVSGYIK